MNRKKSCKQCSKKNSAAVHTDDAGMNLPAVKKKHRDSVFRKLFNNKTTLLHLYNALNETSYNNPDDLEINTLENAIYATVKNDVSFLFDFQLQLYEHQSTVNPNMPLRYFLYAANLYAKMIDNKKLHTSTLVRIPAPRFVIFYNGVQKQPEKMELHLSEAFTGLEGKPSLELLATMYNINVGYNEKLVHSCEELHGYQIFVEKVRRYQKSMPLAEAVDMSVRECIEENILKEFLTENRSEVVHMSIFEFDQEEYEQAIREDAFEVGLQQGIERGVERGKLEEKEALAARLLDILDDTMIAKKTELSVEKIVEIRRKQGLL